MSVFALTLMRVCWRAIFPPPKSPKMPAWMEVGARLAHWAIYTLLVLVPVTAILGAWFEGHPLTMLAVGRSALASAAAGAVNAAVDRAPAKSASTPQLEWTPGAGGTIRSQQSLPTAERVVSRSFPAQAGNSLLGWQPRRSLGAPMCRQETGDGDRLGNANRPPG
jgi:hypothetical protein